ncbi:MAG: hypothetical protein ACHP7P_09310 [Terriglobales bacterium]
MRSSAFALVLFVVVSSFSHIATAQSGCTAYFTSYTYIYLPVAGSLRPGMTRKQEKWFHKKGRKKYPALCEDAEKATYVLVTGNQVNEVQRPETVTRHAYTTGPVTEVVGNTSSGPIWATRFETFVTTWQEKEMRTGLQLHTEVFLLEAKKPLREAVSADDYYQPLRAAYADGPDADEKAFEHAFWFLDLAVRAKKESNSASH